MVFNFLKILPERSYRLKTIDLSLEIVLYSISHYVDDSVCSIETRNYHQKCLDSLKSILNHLRNNLCALSV